MRDFGATLSGCTKIMKSFSRGISRITFLVLSTPPHASLPAEQTLFRNQSKVDGQENKRALRNQKQALFCLVVTCLIGLYKHFPSTYQQNRSILSKLTLFTIDTLNAAFALFKTLL